MKKLLTILLSVFMIATSLTMNIFADDEYDLKINGVKVTSTMMNESGVIDNSKVGNAIKSGTVSYTPASGSNPAKLTLNNATIESIDNAIDAVRTDLNDLVVELIGMNTVSADDGDAFIFNKESATFIGSGSLIATGNQRGLYFRKDATFGMGGTVTATSSKNAGIYCCGNINLIAGAGKVIAHGFDKDMGAIAIDGEGSVVGCKSILGSTDFSAIEASVTSPATITGYPDWKESKIVSSGETAKTIVLTAFPPTYYDLWINDVHVTSAMMDENGVIDNSKVGNVIKSGAVSYTPASGSNPAKLRLNNATIEITEANKNGFYTEEEEIVIELIGNNSVSARATNFALYGGNASFIGSGSLNVTNYEADAIYVSGNCTFGMSGTLTAISNSNLAIGSSNNINIEVGTGKIIAHGENSLSGAFYWGTNKEISGYKTAVGSTLFNETDERNMTTATAADGCFKVGDPGTIAKTVVLTAFPPDYLWFSATGGDVKLEMTNGTTAPDISLEYSSDGQEWKNFVENKTVTPIVIVDGTKVYIRNKASADKIADSVDTEYRRFTMSSESANASVSVGGSIMSLLDKSASITEFVDLEKSEYAFYQLFRDCELLTDASELKLPAGQTKELPKCCYREMFISCTNMTAVPTLPATKLGGYCYMSMFDGCESLETAPLLPATKMKEGCYDMMFMGCENLKTAPLLPATKMANECYYSMFQWCENLETAPELPATELAYMCYYCMFNGCVKLTSAPELPATTLAESCYEEMFNGCEKLNYIKVGFSAWNDENDATYYWVNGVAPTGNFVCPETLDNSGHIDSIHGVPIGWTTNIDFSAKICGNVSENSIGVPNATVELYLGTTKIATTTTDTSGNYSFNNVEKGTYNIVVTKADGSKTKTELVTIETSGTKTIDVVLPTSSVNSIVEHAGNEVENAKSNISQTVVGGLDAIAEAPEHAPSGGDKITIKLKVEPKKESELNSTTVVDIKQKAGNGKKVEFIDMSLIKLVNDVSTGSIGDTNTQILTIVIPFDFTNTDVNSVMIIRKHGDNTVALNKGSSNAVDGEYFEIDEAKGTITIYAKRFSDYAIAYTNIESNPPSNHKPRYNPPKTGVE